MYILVCDYYLLTLTHIYMQIFIPMYSFIDDTLYINHPSYDCHIHLDISQSTDRSLTISCNNVDVSYDYTFLYNILDMDIVSYHLNVHIARNINRIINNNSIDVDSSIINSSIFVSDLDRSTVRLLIINGFKYIMLHRYNVELNISCNENVYDDKKYIEIVYDDILLETEIILD